MRAVWGCLAIPVLLVVAAIAWIAVAPSDGFQIGCKTDLIYTVQATIESGGRRIDGEATSVKKSERFQYGRMFTWNGCGPAKGRAIAFRLPDNRLLFMSSALCHDAREQLAEHGEVDALPICYSQVRRRQQRENISGSGQAYLFDDADAPSEYRIINFGDGDVDIVALRATRRYWASAADTLEEVAPALLVTEFADDNNWNSPYMLIPDRRRDGRPYEHVAHIAIVGDGTAREASR